MYMNFVLMFFLQHANEDVEKMILGNKCDMEDKRQVSKERGDTVRITYLYLRAIHTDRKQTRKRVFSVTNREQQIGFARNI